MSLQLRLDPVGCDWERFREDLIESGEENLLTLKSYLELWDSRTHISNCRDLKSINNASHFQVL